MVLGFRQAWNVHQPTPSKASGIVTVHNWGEDDFARKIAEAVER